MRLFRLIGALAYPVAMYLALKFFGPRQVGAVLLLTLAIRYRRQSKSLWHGSANTQRVVMIGLIALSMAVTITGSVFLLHLLPMLISLSMLLIFGYTLRHPPSMIERFARQVTPVLPPEAITYTLNVTRLWCGFFMLNAIIAFFTATPAGQPWWLLYNGLLSYIAMGALFAGEWLYRHWRFPEKKQ